MKKKKRAGRWEVGGEKWRGGTHKAASRVGGDRERRVEGGEGEGRKKAGGGSTLLIIKFPFSS
jgi:hypothetical protein